jgi:peptidoglycan hydrolase-like protein with peptidoglycan-binding domain
VAEAADPRAKGQPRPNMPANLDPKRKTSDALLVQQVLQARGWRRIKLTGMFDATTASVLRQFQIEKGLKHQDGKLHPETWEELWDQKITWP